MSASVEQQLRDAGLDDQAGVCWADFQRVTGSDTVEPVWWRDRRQLSQLCEALGFSEPVRQALRAAAVRIDHEAPHWWTLLAVTDRLWRCDDDDLRSAAMRRQRPPRTRWGELADLFPALTCLTGLRDMVQRHRQMGIPEQITRDTADDLALGMERYFHEHGAWGTTMDSGWFHRHLRLKLYALGRLQFEIVRFHFPYLVLIDEAGRVAALLEPGQEMRPDGQFASADRGQAVGDSGNWTSALTETADAWTGHAIHARGFAQRSLRRFDKTRWRVGMKCGDPALSVHIPARGKLDATACRQSFALAQQFFPRYFPRHRAAGFFCVSWLMDPQLAAVLDEPSNICRFLSLFHSLPFMRGDDEQFFDRVFGGRLALADAPRDTVLRRRILEHMEAGGRWRTALGIRLCSNRVPDSEAMLTASHGQPRAQ